MAALKSEATELTIYLFSQSRWQLSRAKTRLQSSHRYAANSLETGVWINDGTGKFDFHALPTLAQASPAFGIVIGHFGGDSQPDLFLAQNFYGPQAETGRADGGVGLLLTGNGDGTFTPIPAHQSGIVVPGDATSAVLADVTGDGNVEILVATNDGPTYTFQRTSTDDDLRVVRLLGRGANPQAVGARVTMSFSDGTLQVAEVACGGGYLSQSTTDLYFGIPNGTVVDRVDVTWPTGETTSSTLVDENGPLTISQP